MQGFASGAASERRWRIAFVHPTSWPYVRRGTERFMAEMSVRLAAAGHSVTIITSKPGPAESHLRDGVTTIFLRSVWGPVMAKAGLHDFHVFPLTTVGPLIRGRFDLIHTFNFTDTLLAHYLKAWTKARVLLHLNTIPPSVRYRRTLSTGGRLVGAAVRKADEVLLISRKQETYFQNRYGRPSVLIPAPVDTGRFPLVRDNHRHSEVLLCASALNDARKGGLLLFRAYNELRPRRPNLRLEICSPLAPELKRRFLQLVDERWHSGIAFIPVDRDEDLLAAYSRASALVLPSLWEAFPLVVLEALACGTPVAGTSDGGIPEILASGGAGEVFHPGESLDGGPSNLQGLVSAIERTLALSEQAQTTDRCRAAANRYSWDVLWPVYLDFYRRLIE